ALESGQGGIRTPEGTSPPDLQSGAIDRSATCPVQRPTARGRASGGTGTPDQRFTKPLLYQLSYAGGTGRRGGIQVRTRRRIVQAEIPVRRPIVSAGRRTDTGPGGRVRPRATPAHSSMGGL